MNRRNILKTAGLAGAASLLPFGKSQTAKAATGLLKKELLSVDCILIPHETAGPFPWPADGVTLSTDTTFFRQDITENLPGIPLSMTFKVVNVNDNCAPVLNAAVVAWHCDVDGNYSEFGTSAGKSFMRGIQITDANGEVTFKTIYPGWYPGRTTHIHFQIFLSSHLSATSQLAFPENITTQVYSATPYATRGQKDTLNTSDGVFFDVANTQYQMVTILGNNTDGYQAGLTVGIEAPTSGVINLEPETGGQFKLMQNFPNPFGENTAIPFSLTNPSNVLLEIFDTNGKKLFNAANEQMEAGDHQVVVNRFNNGALLSAGAYLYQITVESSKGSFRQCKVMTIN